MVKALDRPEKAQLHTLSFTFGNPEQTVRFTNWDSAIDPNGLNFLSEPAIEIDLAPNVGTFGEAPTKIKMIISPQTTAFLDPLTRGTPFAPVQVVISEIIDPSRAGDAGNTQIVAAGVIRVTRRNADGRTGLVVIHVRNQKTLLDIALGFQVNAHCVFRLNGPGCREPGAQSPSGYTTQSAAIAIDGKQITITDSGLVFDLSLTKTWTRGFIERDNVKIGIFEYDKTQDGNTTKLFQLVRQAPSEWEGQSVTFFPGCTKQIDGDGGCRVAWLNEEAFGGSGFAIPAHNPITENPQG